MSLEDLKTELNNDIKTILSADFDVAITLTSVVPTIETQGITYPNLDTKEMDAKRIHTCVLYIDIRKSTELNLKHKPHTLTKLYASFMRSMVKAAQYFNGKVRNIIGDRVMVVFDEKDCFKNAIDTACLLNSVSQYILNKHFTKNEITCGIGIDYGRMLVSKGGITKNGAENAPYKSLVWLGRPANVASKLTDLANKEVEIKVAEEKEFLSVAEQLPGNGFFTYSQMSYKDFFSRMFDIRPDLYLTQNLKGEKVYRSNRPNVVIFTPHTMNSTKNILIKTPPVLMTEKVFEGFKKAYPNSPEIVGEHWKKQSDTLYPGYTVYGGNLTYPSIRS